MLRIAIYAALLLALVTGGVTAWLHHNKAEQTIGYDRRAEEDKAASLAQTARNRELQRMAELHYTTAATVRDHFFTRTAKEIHHEAESLATCPVPEPLRLRLNAAAGCARGDSPAACLPDGGVPGAR